MITKVELLKKIDEAIITEEDAVILYSRHLKTIMPWSGLNSENQAEIIKALNTLSDESTRHKELLTFLRNDIDKKEKMFSRNDFIKYFNQISDVEKKMLSNIDELLGLLGMDSSVEILNKIKKDEIKHIEIVKKIGRLIDENKTEIS